MKLYFIRHGETTGDIENRYGGSYDDHLTEKGREQIKSTAQRLSGKEIERIFSSPLIRAKEASEIIKDVIGSPVELIDGLRERDYGILTGLAKEEAEEKYLDAVEAHKDYKNTDPEGESYDDFQKRVMQAFQSIASDRNYNAVAIVTHGGPIKCIWRSLGKGELGDIGDGEIIELEYQLN